MPELIDWAIVLIAGSSLIFAYIAYRAVMRTTTQVNGLLSRIPSFKGLLSPQIAADIIKGAYPPEHVAAIINAVVEKQKPSILAFAADEIIPALAVAGGGEVASDARLARSVKSLGSGASGLQGLIAMIAKPAKNAAKGDLMGALMPMFLEKFMSGGMGAAGNGGQPSMPSSQSQTVDWHPPV